MHQPNFRPPSARLCLTARVHGSRASVNRVSSLRRRAEFQTLTAQAIPQTEPSRLLKYVFASQSRGIPDDFLPLGPGSAGQKIVARRALREFFNGLLGDWVALIRAGCSRGYSYTLSGAIRMSSSMRFGLLFRAFKTPQEHQARFTDSLYRIEPGFPRRELVFQYDEAVLDSTNIGFSVRRDTEVRRVQWVTAVRTLCGSDSRSPQA